MKKTAMILAGLATAAGCSAQAQDAIIQRGHDAFQYSCAPCHGAGIGNPGRGSRYLPGTDSLRVKYQGAVPALLEERTDLTPEFVTYVVRHGIFSMPSFRKTELSDENLRAIAAYLARNNPQAGSGR